MNHELSQRIQNKKSLTHITLDHSVQIQHLLNPFLPPKIQTLRFFV